jgi:DNA-binding LacI/PurR family transcriptional regulator
MDGKKMTIKDIARLAGVSPTAVSFAINGKDGISGATRQKILSVISENHFYPSVASQRLTSHKSFNIAFIYPTAASPFTDLFYYEVAQGFTEELTERGYNVVFVPLICEGQEYKTPNIIRRKDADGAVFLYDVPSSLLTELDDYGLPYILVDWQSAEEQRTNITLDCERSVVGAMRYLIEKGHRSIGFFGSDRFPQYYLRCFAGYQKALADSELPIYPNWIQNTVHNAEDAAVSLQKINSAQIKPTAVCCISDMCAIHSMRAAAGLGIKIPEDLSFISIDDILLSRYVQPPLTTVSYEKSELGKTAARLLLQKLNGEEAHNIVVHSDTVIERRSVRTVSDNADAGERD